MFKILAWSKSWFWLNEKSFKVFRVLSETVEGVVIPCMVIESRVIYTFWSRRGPQPISLFGHPSILYELTSMRKPFWFCYSSYSSSARTGNFSSVYLRGGTFGQRWIRLCHDFTVTGAWYAVRDAWEGRPVDILKPHVRESCGIRNGAVWSRSQRRKFSLSLCVSKHCRKSVT